MLSVGCKLGDPYGSMSCLCHIDGTVLLGSTHLPVPWFFAAGLSFQDLSQKGALIVKQSQMGTWLRIL